jgi:hypothetical protein
VDLNRPFKGSANPLWEEFKYLSFGYTKAVSIQPNTLPYANLAASLLPSRKTDGVVA